ncbi:tetratricopeptide repeat-containing sensor histidine kinase [Kordia sp.]|uniref:tetratricopeptide repeat-containing sensor histidine kinase n=1 Tax=Kordia sp. TaxID=1965332 RepID=UPI003D6C5D03
MKQLSESPDNTELKNYCLLFRGISFHKKQLYDEAKKEFTKIPKDFLFHNNIILYLGEIALSQNKVPEAIRYFKQVEKLNTSEIFGVKKSVIDQNLGTCYLLQEEFEKAEFYLLKSTKAQEIEKDTIKLIGSYGDIANLYYSQYKDAQAIPYFEKAYELSKMAHNFDLRRKTALNMSVVEEELKNYPKAIQYRKEYDRWKDSVNDQNKIYATAQAEKKIEVEKEQKKVAIIKADNKVKIAERNTYLYSAIVLLLMLGVSAYLYHEKVKRNKIINEQKERLDELNATKDKLFSIVSHDLRSSVNAIKTSNKKLINTLETKKLTEVNSLLQNNSSIVNGAYNLLDNLLNWALLQTKQSHFEITKLHLFRIVEHVAYNYKAILADKEISFKNTISKDNIVYVDKESLKIILRNLIDNAIKFSNPKDKISVYTNNDNSDFCQLIVEDTGIGMNNTTRKELLKDTSLLAKKQHEDILGTGLGMQLCKSMIKKNNGTFSIQSELGKGTKMMISLPKNLPNG